MSNLFHTTLLKTSRAGVNSSASGPFNRSFVKAIGLPLALALLLGGCQAQAVKPEAQQLSRLGRILVVPVESPPLEVIPDPIRSRAPVYGQYQYETVPSTLLMNKKLYRNQGGILIAGLVAESELTEADGSLQISDLTDQTEALVPATQASAYWSPSRMLAQDAAEQLTTDRLKATLSDSFYRLPMPGGDRAAEQGAWREAISRWYEQDRSSVDYRQADLNRIDAVLEVGISSYRIFENQTSLKVLVKLVDPATGQVIGRSSAQTQAAEDSAKSLLSRESERFKTLIAGLGRKLVARNLSELGLPFRQTSGNNQVALTLNRPAA
ncbi:hypothetical protein [Methylosarcina fibrata]|uniref:hypothetical protein n=1 Tax=Methylosarcina fibrata TaxID=105972 RepID=UPI00036FBACA|nr:hypothetical protein [Methylosarcina fibrata]